MFLFKCTLGAVIILFFTWVDLGNRAIKLFDRDVIIVKRFGRYVCNHQIHSGAHYAIFMYFSLPSLNGSHNQ